MRRKCLAAGTILLIGVMVPFWLFEALVATVGHRLRAPRLPPEESRPGLAGDALWLALGERGNEVARFGFEDILEELGGLVVLRKPRSRPAGHRAAMHLAREARGWGRLRYRIPKELAYTAWLTRNATPTQMKQWLVETSYLGRGSHGIEAAARAHFCRPSERLSIAETAQLAAQLPSPARFEGRPEVLQRARNALLLKLWVAGAISVENFDVASASPLTTDCKQ